MGALTKGATPLQQSICEYGTASLKEAFEAVNRDGFWTLFQAEMLVHDNPVAEYSLLLKALKPDKRLMWYSSRLFHPRELEDHVDRDYFIYQCCVEAAERLNGFRNVTEANVA